MALQRAEPRPQAARGQGGRRRMGRRRGGLRGGSWRRTATGGGGGCVPAAARPSGGKVRWGEHQGGQAAVGRAVLARGRAQGGPAAHAGGGRRVPRWRGFDSTAAAPIRVGNRSGSRRRPRLSSPWFDLGRRRPRRVSSTWGGEARGDGNGGHGLELDFGRGRARPRSWRDGGASGRGRAARSATD